MQTTTGFKVDANVNPFEAAMRRMVDSAKQGESGVGSALAGLATGPLGGLRAAFTLLAGIASGAFLQAAIDGTVKMTENAMDLGRALGLSTNEARAIQIALKDIGAESGEYEAAAKGMIKKIKENEEGLNKMGLATRDAAGNLRPMNELMVDGIKVLGTYKEGTDRAMASTEIFGKGISSSSKLMLLNQEVTDESRAAMKEFGLEVGENAVAAYKDFDAASDRAGFAVDGFTKGIGDALLPALTTLTEVFASIMPAAIVVVKGALSGLTTTFLLVRNGVAVLWETINAMVVTVAEPIRALVESIARAINGDFAGAASSIKNIGTTIAGAWDNAMQSMTESSRKTSRQVSALFYEDNKTGTPVGAVTGSKNFTGKAPAPDKAKAAKAAKAEKGDKDVSAMQTYEQTLEYAKLAFEKENTLRSYNKQQELAYWKDILTTYEVGAKDKGAINLKVAKLEVETMRQSAKDQKEISALRGEDWRNETLDYINELQSRAAFDKEQGTTTQAQYLERMAAFNAMRLQAEMEFIAQKMQVAQLDPENNLVLLEQLEMQKLELRRNYKAQANDIALQQAAELAVPINAINASIMQGLSTVTTNMLTNWKSLATSLRSVLRDIGMSIIQETIIKPQLAKIAAFTKDRLMNIAGIGGDAAKAASGAAASQASIPFAGPVLAMAAMAAMLAAVGGMSARVPSAAGGFDIPAGLNPMTQLHAKEMVLPEHIATPLRDSLAGGGGVGGGTTNVTIHAMDSRSFEQFLQANPAAFAAGMKTAARRGF